MATSEEREIETRAAEKRVYTPFTDPCNGFRGIYRLISERAEYTLVAVPPDADFIMEYERQLNEVDLTLEPKGKDAKGKDTLDWVVMGQVDTNHYEHLGLPIARERRRTQLTEDGRVSILGENGPLVLPENLKAARKYGEIEELGLGERVETQLYRVALTLPPHKIAAFLKSIWVPDALILRDPTVDFVIGTRVANTKPPQMNVGYNIGEERVLPQRQSIRPPFLTRLSIVSGPWRQNSPD